MNRCKTVLHYAGIYAGTILALWLFLIVAAMIPNSMIRENMEQSARTYCQVRLFEYADGEKMNGIADNYADAMWVNIAWHMGRGNPVVSSIDTKYYDKEQQGPNVGLYLAVTQGDTEANTDYTRYWHGTAGVIRILHLFTDVSGIKYVGFITVLCLAVIIMILLIKDGKDTVAIIFFLSLCIVKIWNIRLSMEYQPAFIIGFVFCVLYILYEKKGNQCLLPLAVVSGAIASFFDFLTTETVTILLPLILVITVRAMDGRIGARKENVVFAVKQCSVWLVSYGMAFPLKWILASVLTGANKFAVALNLAEERMNGTVPVISGENRFAQILAAPAANLSALFGGTERIDTVPLIIGILLVVFFITISVIAIWKGKEESKAASLLLLMLGIVVLVRYMTLNNHSYLHVFFTYRGLISLIMAMFSIIVIHLNDFIKKQHF